MFNNRNVYIVLWNSLEPKITIYVFESHVNINKVEQLFIKKYNLNLIYF